MDRYKIIKYAKGKRDADRDSVAIDATSTRMIWYILWKHDKKMRCPLSAGIALRQFRPLKKIFFCPMTDWSVENKRL